MKHSTLQWYDPADTLPEPSKGNAPPQPLLLMLQAPTGTQVMTGAYLIPQEASGMPPFPIFAMMMVMMSPQGPMPIYSPIDPNTDIKVLWWAAWPQVDDLYVAVERH